MHKCALAPTKMTTGMLEIPEASREEDDVLVVGASLVSSPEYGAVLL